jgi:hypothetical protein
MRTYWDSSALVAATMDPGIRGKLREADQFTRTHSLAEVFSTPRGVAWASGSMQPMLPK